MEILAKAMKENASSSLLTAFTKFTSIVSSFTSPTAKVGIVVVANTSLLPLISSFMSFSTCLPLFTIDTVNWCAVLM